MLKQLSRFERTSKVLILGFVGLMALSLVLFFRPNGGSSGIEPTKSTQVLAKVNGAEITVGDFATQKLNIQNQFSRFGGQISLTQMGYTDEKILSGLISKKVTEQEASRPGRGPTSTPRPGQECPAAGRHGQRPTQERPQPQRAQVHLPAQFGISGQHDLEPAIQEKAVPAVGADPPAYLVTGFADRDGQAGAV